MSREHKEIIVELIHAGVPDALVDRIKIALAHKAITARKVRLPEEWKPRHEDIQSFMDLGWSWVDVEDEIAHFVDHARAGGRTAIDWDAAFRNWMRSPFQKKGPDNDKRSILKAGDRLTQRTGGNARDYKPGSSGPGSMDLIEGPSGVRRIPKR